MKTKPIPFFKKKTLPIFNLFPSQYLVFRLLKNHRFWVSLLILIGLALCFLSPLKVLFDQSFLVEHLQKYSCCAVAIFIALYIILTIVGVPGTILTLAGGIAFGLSWGTFWSVVGATLGAIGAFWLARYLLHDTINHKFGHHPALAKFKKAVQHQPLSFVLTIRFAPISPFNIVNFLFGLTPIHWIPYSLGTFIGIIPGTLAYTWLGVSGSRALQGEDSLSFFLALGILTLLSIMPMLLGKKISKSASLKSK
jgi:uncharacterized membrane protein YdjX (TVP38/TMEM64 family)